MILSRLKEPKELKDDRTETMLKIYEDSSMAADTQHRQAHNTTNQLSFWIVSVEEVYLVLQKKHNRDIPKRHKEKKLFFTEHFPY